MMMMLKVSKTERCCTTRSDNQEDAAQPEVTRSTRVSTRSTCRGTRVSTLHFNATIESVHDGNNAESLTNLGAIREYKGIVFSGVDPAWLLRIPLGCCGSQHNTSEFEN